MPVPGTSDIFDLIPAPGEVTEEGTFINKENMLDDDTAAEIGLDPGNDPTPNDAFLALNMGVRSKKNKMSEFERLITGRLI